MRGATLRVEPGQYQTQRAKLLSTPASSFVPNRSTQGNLAPRGPATKGQDLKGLVVGQGSQGEPPGIPYAGGKWQAEEGQQQQDAPIPLGAHRDAAAGTGRDRHQV